MNDPNPKQNIEELLGKKISVKEFESQQSEVDQMSRDQSFERLGLDSTSILNSFFSPYESPDLTQEVLEEFANGTCSVEHRSMINAMISVDPRLKNTAAEVGREIQAAHQWVPPIPSETPKGQTIDFAAWLNKSRIKLALQGFGTIALAAAFTGVYILGTKASPGGSQRLPSPSAQNGQALAYHEKVDQLTAHMKTTKDWAEYESETASRVARERDDAKKAARNATQRLASERSRKSKFAKPTSPATLKPEVIAVDEDRRFVKVGKDEVALVLSKDDSVRGVLQGELKIDNHLDDLKAHGTRGVGEYDLKGSPANTAVMPNKKLVLMWSAPKMAVRSYTVTISAAGEDENVFSSATNQVEVPGPLKLGATYTWNVTADTGAGTVSGDPQRFRVLDQAQANRAQSVLADEQMDHLSKAIKLAQVGLIPESKSQFAKVTWQNEDLKERIEKSLYQ